MGIPGVLSGHKLRSHLLNKQIEAGAFSCASPLGVDLGITLGSWASQPCLDQQSFWILLRIANRVKSACKSFTHLSPFVVALRFCWPEGVSYFLTRFFKDFFFSLGDFFFAFFKPFFPWSLQNLQGHPQGSSVALLQCSWGSHPPYLLRWRHVQLSIISLVLLLHSGCWHSMRGERVSCSKPNQERSFPGEAYSVLYLPFCLVWFLRVDNRISVSSQVSQTCH